MVIEKMRLKCIHEVYVEKPDKWVTHRRSKNYIAQLKGFDSQYTFKRKFLDRGKLGTNTFFYIEDFKEGEIYEIKCIYYTGSGRSHPRLDGFFRCDEVNKKEVVLTEICEEKVIEILKEKYSETMEISNREKNIEKLEKEKIERKEKLEALKEAEEALKNEIDSILIDEERIKKVREELKSRIRKIANNLLNFASQKNGIKIYEADNIKIKAKENDIEYIKIGSAYVFGYGEPSLKGLIKTYQILKDELMKNKDILQKIEECE